MRTLTSFLLLVTLISCEKKGEYSVKSISKEFCNCFNTNQAEKNIDARLKPCVDKYINHKHNDILEHKDYGLEFLNKAISEFSLDLFIELIHSCDLYYYEMSALYNNTYLADTTDSNKKNIALLTARLQTATNKDSIKSLLHKRTARLIKSRNFNAALEDISKIKTLDINDEDALLASAYIFNQLGMEEKALTEIEKGIAISQNNGYYIFREITKRRIEEKVGKKAMKPTNNPFRINMKAESKT
jgi:tetratricopeptide (TPR) repeat protein